jgi:hypothetical protein
MISFEPALVAGKRIYTIVFSSNAPNPGNFDGTDSDALVADGNQEIWIYRLPEIDDTFDLASGNDITPVSDLTLGTFRQVTDTPPSRPLRTGIFLPDIVDDNREATISDDGNTLAFISNRDLVTAVGNTDGNAELFLVRTSNGFAPGSNTVVQGTNTADVFATPKTYPAFQQNPSLSANGAVVAFSSTANMAGTNDDCGHTNGNEEVFVADFSGSAVSNVRQLTKTKKPVCADAAATINVLSAGRRLSRDGAYVVYESRAADPTANNTTNAAFLSIFVSKVSDGTAKMVGQRPPECATCIGDVIHFPTFTDYDGALAPHALVFAAALNFKPDGTIVEKTDATGLNATPAELISPNQVFVTQMPVTDTNTFARLTKNPAQLAVSGIRPLTSNALRRLAFSMAGLELGGGNSDGSSEVFYLLTPPVTTEASAVLSFFTGASNMGPFAAADPSASPSPTPTPTPSPGDPTGLSAGELSIVRSTVGLADSDQIGVGGSETARSPILPVELNGVSVAIQNVAAGLYFVGDTPSEGIRFVVPIGFTTGVASVVINNRGTVYRGFLRIVASQPDIHTDTDDAGGNAEVCNVSNPLAILCVGPFQVTSPFDASGTLAPTRLEIYATGVRNASRTETKVSFVNGTTTIDVVPDAVRPNTNMLGLDVITVTLPATLAGAAPIDYKLIVTVTKTNATTGSRTVATAPQITIIP